MCFHLQTKKTIANNKKTLVQSKTMRYIGVSRGIQQSLRLNLTRRPKETYYFKVCGVVCVVDVAVVSIAGLPPLPWLVR